MADKYPNFEFLARHETPGIDFRILVRRAAAGFAVIAPHGGGIEPGTSEIADAIAGEEFSFYAFEGLKLHGNADLHITSTRFDEPMCLTLVDRSEIVVALHGENDTDSDSVFLGGLDEGLICSVRHALEAGNFDVRRHPDPRLQGREPGNLCNRGRSGRGVQLELSRALRASMFRSLSREGRKQKAARFHDFVGALRDVLDAERFEKRTASLRSLH
jgi:phage replication-related protein YjqB (UPF0714/DUF867 family)